MRYRNQLVALALVLGLVFLMPWKAIGDGASSLAKTIAATQSGTWTVQPGNTANTTAWKVDGSAVTQPVSGTFWQATQPVSISGNQAVNVAQINGVTPLMGNGASGTGAQRVTIASDSTGQVAIASLPNEGQQTMANSISVSLASDQTVPDPCMFRAKSYAPINSSSATTTQLVAASASNKLYICAIHMLTNAANNVALVEDDTSACASPTAGIIGGTTAATGYPFTANGGLTLGSGTGTVGITAATNRYVCVITSAATQLSGGLSYVLAP